MEVDLLEHVVALFWSTEMQFILYPIVPSHVLSDLCECIWVLIYNFFNADKLFLWVVCQPAALRKKLTFLQDLQSTDHDW